METNSSGEELIVKTRKPYTITKQRERWTEEEHNKFIEALKLYGRAWQRIEEHIGTKTAVQIRSHAQKFFTKLEKEAITKGIPSGQVHDIEIPPPRPKRKPNSPYPRKTSVGSLSPSGETTDEKISKSPTCKQATDMENNAPWKIQGTKDNSEEGSQSEVLNQFQDAPSASMSSFNTCTAKPSAYNRFAPLMKELKEKTSSQVSCVSIKVNKGLKGNVATNTVHGTGGLNGICSNSQRKPAAEEGADITKQPEKLGPASLENLQGAQGHPKHVHVDFMKESSNGTIPSTVTNHMGSHANAEAFLNPMTHTGPGHHTESETSSTHQTFPAFPPFTQFPSNQDSCRSFINFSSSFSSLIVSTLLQNPAVHEAATLAASFWPFGGMESSINSSSEALHGNIPVRPMNSCPSMAAIAAATVAAASAWWATQGLLPIFPLHAGFTFSPVPAATIPTVDNVARDPNNRKEEKDDTTQNCSRGTDQQVADLEQSEAMGAQQPLSKLSGSSSSDSDQTEGSELKSSKTIKLKPLLGINNHDSEKAARSKKEPDRSSCGSNTSSSEVETDLVLNKQEEAKEAKEEAKQITFNNSLSGENNSRRTRSTLSLNELWKEVSEEGRLAFQALFTREVLPQSFSPPNAITAKGRQVTTESPVDLNKACASETMDLYHVQGLNKEMSVRSGDTIDKVPEIGHGKLKLRRTGFKPYKRFSVEAKENRTTPGNESGNKRIRLQGETST